MLAESACSRPFIFSRGQSPRVVSSLPSSTVRGLAWAAHRLEARRETKRRRENPGPTPRKGQFFLGQTCCHDLLPLMSPFCV